MTILALEFSSARRSVAVTRGESLLAEAEAQTAGRGTDAFGLIDKVLQEAHLTREAIEVIAVGLGPGSYTGIRAAIAVAQGWQLAREIKLLGVSSMESLALQAQSQAIRGVVDLVVDAQRGEFYVARYNLSNSDCCCLEPLKIISANEVAARKSAGVICAGPEAERKLFPSASTDARLAFARSDFVTGEKLEPVYLRETNFVKASSVRTV